MLFISKFTKRDFKFAVLTGLITGVIAWRVLAFLWPGLFNHTIWGAGFMVGVPILWILGVLLGYFLGQWIQFFNQFGKFAAIGFTNAAVYFGVLDTLISRTDYTAGVGYSVLSSISFIIALVSSYIWNKYWAFSPEGRSASGGQVQNGAGEFTKFFIVTLIAFGINVGVSAFVVNIVHPVLGMDARTWANIGAVAGSATGLIFSFTGYRMAVFKN